MHLKAQVDFMSHCNVSHLADLAKKVQESVQTLKRRIQFKIQELYNFEKKRIQS